MIKSFSRALGILALAALSLPTPSNADTVTWAVKLTPKQQAAAQELKTKKKHTALAISSKGVWGNAWNYATRDEARAKALEWCRQHVAKGQPDCTIYMEDGKIVAGQTITAKKITKTYKAVSGKQAAKFFGLRAVEFTGDVATATAQYEAFKAGKTPRHDKALAAKLRGASLTQTKNGGLAYVFENKGAAYANKLSATNIHHANFNRWFVTSAGLLCMVDGAFDTGKPMGNLCFYLHGIKGGEVRWQRAWYDKLGVEKGFLVAGNAAVTTAR